MNLFPKTIKPGDVIDLHGDVAIPRSIKIPAGKPVTIRGNAHIHFAGTGKVIGQDGYFVFNVGQGAQLIVESGLYFDLTPSQGVFKLSYDPKKGGKISNGPIVHATGIWQKNGCLFWNQGMQEVIGIGCHSDGVPAKYYVMNSTNPNGKLVLDFRPVNDKIIRGGKTEGVIRTMQLQRFEMYGGIVRGQTKQDVQLRSGGTALLQGVDMKRLACGFMEDDAIKNVDPLDRVDLNGCKIGSIDWGNGQTGKVYRDNKLIHQG